MNRKYLRLLNFVIDTGIYISIMLIIVSIFKGSLNEDGVKWISILVYFLYYFLFELFLRQTPGKIITKTKVILINENYKYFMIKVFFRSVMRFIPIDIISYLFYYRGLHDWISFTTVKKNN